MNAGGERYGRVTVRPVTEARVGQGHGAVVRQPDAETDIVEFFAVETDIATPQSADEDRLVVVIVYAGVRCVCGIELRATHFRGCAQIGEEGPFVADCIARGGAEVAALMYAMADHLEEHGVRASRVRVLRERAASRELLAVLTD